MSEPQRIRDILPAVMADIENRMEQAKEKHLIAYCDGAAEPTNPGPMGCGYVLQDEAGKQIEAKGFFLGHGSNNTAEYMAVVKAAEAAVRLGVTRLDIRTDSQLVVKQIHGLWVINKDHLRALREKALALLNQIGHWTLEWIPRERNEQADVCAVNAAMFKKDVDYSGRTILATENPRAARILEAAGAYLHQHRGQDRSFRRHKARAAR